MHLNIIAYVCIILVLEHDYEPIYIRDEKKSNRKSLYMAYICVENDLVLNGNELDKNVQYVYVHLYISTYVYRR